MIDTDDLSRHRPATMGPNRKATERATLAFGNFLDSQARVAAGGRSVSTRVLWRSRSLVIAGMAVVLLVAGSVAYATFAGGDGVFYVEPATQIAQDGDLSLVMRESNIGLCLEVRLAQATAGGCGGVLDEPLGVSTGGIGDVSFTFGWGPGGTAKIEMTFPNGEIVEVADFEMLPRYDAMFFIATLPPTLGREPSLPLQALAFDSDGDILAVMVQDEAPTGH